MLVHAWLQTARQLLTAERCQKAVANANNSVWKAKCQYNNRTSGSRTVGQLLRFLVLHKAACYGSICSPLPSVRAYARSAQLTTFNGSGTHVWLCVRRTLPDRKCIFISTKKLAAFSTSAHSVRFHCSLTYVCMCMCVLYELAHTRVYGSIVAFYSSCFIFIVLLLLLCCSISNKSC